jgi:hypothetical protein
MRGTWTTEEQRLPSRTLSKRRMHTQRNQHQMILKRTKSHPKQCPKGPKKYQMIPEKVLERGPGVTKRTCDSRDQEILAGVAVAMLDEGLADGVEVVGEAVGFSKCRAMVEAAVEYSRLGPQQFDHFSYCHPAGKAVGVHDEVWADSSLREWQVLLGNDEPNDSLLAMPRAELVAQFWAPVRWHCIQRLENFEGEWHQITHL